MQRRFAKVLAGWALFALLSVGATAAVTQSDLTPAKPGWPLAHPIAQTDIPPPPFSLIADRPKDPAYVAGLPGLPQGRVVTDDYGVKRPKFDAVFIRKSRVENGQVVIPAGGLAYLEDTFGGEVALRGEPLPVLSKTHTYIDYDMSIVINENVTIPAGQSVTVGGQVYHYYATVGHEQMASHALHVKTIAGTDWDWAFGNPVLSATETNWFGTGFTQLYNQGKAREVTRDRMVFDWISGVRMDRLLVAEDKVFAGLARAGQEWKAGDRAVRLSAVNEAAGTVQVQVLEGGAVKFEKTLGPVKKELLLEDTTARKALVFEFADVAGFLVPGLDTFKDGQANLKIYGKASSLRYGEPFAPDPRFTVYPVGCPTGHNFGFMLVNKDEIRLAPGASASGPEGYFKITVGEISGDEVRAWHIADRDGNQSVNLGGPGVTNVDLVLGQGRVSGQAILKDVGRATLVRTYNALERAQGPSGGKPTDSSLAWSTIIGLAIGALALLGFGFELGRRKHGQTK